MYIYYIKPADRKSEYPGPQFTQYITMTFFVGRNLPTPVKSRSEIYLF